MKSFREVHYRRLDVIAKSTLVQERLREVGGVFKVGVEAREMAQQLRAVKSMYHHCRGIGPQYLAPTYGASQSWIFCLSEHYIKD